MGTPGFGATVMRSILSAGHQVLAVFCQPDSPRGRDLSPVAPEAKVCAVEFAVPVLQPGRIGPKSRATLEALAPDVVVVAAYGHILPAAALAIPRHGCINVHTSLLPKYRGAAPIRRAIAAGETVTGVTIMQMAEGMDTGDILAQETEPIHGDDTWHPLQDRLAVLGSRVLVETLARIERGETLARIPQDEAQATYAPPLKREEGAVDWTLPGVVLANRCRAFHPWPGTHTTFRGKQLKLFPFLSLRPPVPGAEPGTVVEVSRSGVAVACSDAVVLLADVQAEGKRRMSSTDFASGARITTGEKLG